MNISFEGIGREIVTVYTRGPLKEGDLCYFYSDKTVVRASENDTFSGKVIRVYEDATASVQIKGYIEVPYTDATTPSTLDMQKYVCTNESAIHRSDEGRGYLVVSQNTEKKTVGIIL